jgi:hypothetical protein
MVAGCPALECLLLHDIYGIPCVRISSHSVKSIGVRVGRRLRTFHFQDTKYRLEELIIEDAPSLEKLLNLNLTHVLHLTVLSAPKLQTLGYVSDFHRGGISRHVLGSTIIQVAVHFCVSINYTLSAFVNRPNVVFMLNEGIAS